MRGLFAEEGKNCIAVSLDDFYVTGEEQDAIAIINHNNSLLQFRGNGMSEFQ